MGSRSPRRNADSSSPSASELVAEAQECLESLPPQIDRARQLFEEALKADGENPEVLDAFGAFLCEEGDGERGSELLTKSIRLRPDQGEEKFLVLAQMSSGEEALGFYERAITVLRKYGESCEGSDA